MAKGYWIVSIDVTDADKYGDYVREVRPFLERCNAKFLVRGGTHEIKEGHFRTRNIVIEFASYQEALERYNCEEYQKIIPLRARASSADMIVAEGL